MERVRVLLANEPPAYREVLALVFQEMQLPADVSCVEPEDLDGEIVRLSPHLVICSRLTGMLDAARIGWLLLYPDGETRAVLSMLGQRTELTDTDFNDLLVLVERTSDLAQAGTRESRCSLLDSTCKTQPTPVSLSRHMSRSPGVRSGGLLSQAPS